MAVAVRYNSTRGKRRSGVERPGSTSWTLLLDWGVVSMTLLSAGASALAALVAFRADDTSAMAEAVLACGAAICATWLGRSASRAARRWHEELVAWHGDDIALLLDERGRILDANDRAAEAYGHPLEAIYRHHLAEFRHADAEDDVDERLASVVARGRMLFETVQRRSDGSPFPAEVSARVVGLRGRKLIHLIVRDVTERNQARERLVAAERLAAVGSVAAAMAHDINNPLCGIQGNLSFALDELGDPSPNVGDVRGALRDAEDSAKRVRDLVRDLNAFANGFAEVDASSDVEAALSEALEVTRGLVANRCRVLVDLPPLPRVSAPARRLAQVFTIVLRDAAQEMPVGEPRSHAIRITAQAESPLSVAVVIEDDGPLVHPAGTPREAPAPGALREGRSGGAGLAAVMGMVRAVGGDVVTESIPGRGNVVRLRLPVASPQQQQQRPRPGVSPSLARSAPR